MTCWKSFVISLFMLSYCRDVSSSLTFPANGNPSTLYLKDESSVNLKTVIPGKIGRLITDVLNVTVPSGHQLTEHATYDYKSSGFILPVHDGDDVSQETELTVRKSVTENSAVVTPDVAETSDYDYNEYDYPIIVEEYWVDEEGRKFVAYNESGILVESGYVDPNVTIFDGYHRWMDMCDEVFLIRNISVPYFTYEVYGFRHYIYFDELSLKYCLPIYLKFADCGHGSRFIKCGDLNSTVFFLLENDCKEQPEYYYYTKYLMALTLLDGDIDAFQKVCDGDLGLEEVDAYGLPVILVKPYLTQFDEYITLYDYLLDDVELAYITSNVYWPCCYGFYDVLWTQKPESLGLVRNWSYLPVGCRVGEIFLVTFIAFIAVVGLVGNLTVMVVMFRGGHRREPSSILRTNLSVADFLICTVVIVPAFYESIALMLGVESGWYDWHYKEYNFSSGVLTTSRPNKLYDVYLLYFSYSEDWFHVVQAHVLCLCSCVSMVIMLSLSFERVILAGWPFKYKKWFTLPRTKAVILFSWSFGLISLVLLSYKDKIHVYWNGITKFSFGALDNHSDNYTAFQIISIILCIFGTLTIIFSVLAVFLFLREQARVAAEWKSLNMRVTGNFVKENIYITVSMILIAFFYIIAFLPVGITIFARHFQVLRTQYPILVFLAWWFLMAGTAINPLVYNMRSSQFKSDMAEQVHKILPKSLKEMVKPCITHPQNKLEKYLNEKEKEAARKGVATYRAESKLAALGIIVDVHPKSS